MIIDDEVVKFNVSFFFVIVNLKEFKIDFKEYIYMWNYWIN